MSRIPHDVSDKIEGFGLAQARHEGQPLDYDPTNPMPLRYRALKAEIERVERELDWWRRMSVILMILCFGAGAVVAIGVFTVIRIYGG